MTRELVIAAYDNYLTWLDMIDPEVKITIYRKGDEEPQWDDEIKIDLNKGRCVHTFFNHIYSNYDNLSDVTFFAQDYPFDHWEDIVEVVNNSTEESRCQLKIEGYYGFHFNTITIPSPLAGRMWSLSPSKHHGNGKVLVCQSNGQPQDSNPNIDVDKYWSMLFKQVPPPAEYEFMPGGHFGITREHAQLRSKEFYKQVCDLLLEDESAPWMIERLECYIFNPNIK
jgi:hypothetical protein